MYLSGARSTPCLVMAFRRFQSFGSAGQGLRLGPVEGGAARSVHLVRSRPKPVPPKVISVRRAPAKKAKYAPARPAAARRSGCVGSACERAARFSRFIQAMLRKSLAQREKEQERASERESKREREQERGRERERERARESESESERERERVREQTSRSVGVKETNRNVHSSAGAVSVRCWGALDGAGGGAPPHTSRDKKISTCLVRQISTCLVRWSTVRGAFDEEATVTTSPPPVPMGRRRRATLGRGGGGEQRAAFGAEARRVGGGGRVGIRVCLCVLVCLCVVVCVRARTRAHVYACGAAAHEAVRRRRRDAAA